MRPKYKVLSVICILVILILFCTIATGCPKKNQPELYDAIFKLELLDMHYKYLWERWEFDLDTNDIYAERKYDGKEYFVQDFFSLPEHPKYQLRWYRSNITSNGILLDLKIEFTYRDINGELQYLMPRTICNVGTYDISFFPDEKSTIIKYRKITLHLKITD